MKTTFFALLLSFFASQAQSISDNPLRLVGTNYYDFNPLIRSLQLSEISSSPFLVFGVITQLDGDNAQVVHNELRRQLTEDFKKQMLLAGPGDLLKLSYATQVLDKWRNGQLSAGELITLDPKTRQIVVDEIEREKQDFYAVAVLVTNLPQDYLSVGRQVRLLALPITSKPTGLQSKPRYDYGQPVNETTGDFSSYFFVTARGFIKKKIISQSENQKTNTQIHLEKSAVQKSLAP